MTKPLLLYSTNTSLAYEINQKYYGQKHFVWCSRYFSRASVPSHLYGSSPSSTPAEIYRRFRDGALGSDFHSSEINNNVRGLRKGVIARNQDNTIDDDLRKYLLAVIEQVKRRDLKRFMPLVYVIPFSLVESIVFQPTVKNRANPLSDEYIIKDLPRDYFDIMDLGEI